LAMAQAIALVTWVWPSPAVSKLMNDER
jgi:hypothetical protein